MALTIIIDGHDRSSIESHAREAVRMLMKATYNPYAPRLPEQADVYMRHHCDEGHTFWGPMSYANGLCSDCRNDPEIREKWAN